jgi:putative transposase
MPNHVHLLVSPAQIGCVSWLMKNVSQRYAQVYNRRYARTGSMWEGRFRSSAIDSARYLMVCQHYIELNPVRANIVPAAHLYPWSSFRANAMGEHSLFLEPHGLYRKLADTPAACWRAYAESFPHELHPDVLAAVRNAINANAALGDDDFVARIEGETGRIARAVPRGRPRNPGVPPDGKKKLTPV